VVQFLETTLPSIAFEKIGYEVKSVEDINCIYLTINPDPRNFAYLPPNSLIISHHKISVYDNRIYKEILENARDRQLNIYNYHLAWDTMVDGVGDSFMQNLGFSNEQVDKKDLV